MPEPTRIYCVVTMAKATRLYLGPSEITTANRLRPGTCFGWGFTPTEAENHALMQRERILANFRLLNIPYRSKRAKLKPFTAPTVENDQIQSDVVAGSGS